MGETWRWTAYGKHPVASDYFRSGNDFPLGRGFSDWVARGYEAVTSRKDLRPGLSSWRFWAKGAGKDGLLCGLVRDSRDSIGRPYPLLVMGTGTLKGWESEWDLLPFACERTWDQIEYVCSLVVADFKKLEEEVQGLRPPQSGWNELTSYREGFGEKLALDSGRAFETQVAGISEKAEISLSLDGGPFEDPFMRLNFWHFLLKRHLKDIPNAVFMGGTLEGTYLALFRRPLTPPDFGRLWSLPRAELKEK